LAKILVHAMTETGTLLSSTDVVSINSLQLSVNIGPDCWNRSRAQPVLVSVYLHLTNNFLNTSGSSDDVRDSVHYGHLQKSISQLASHDAIPFGNIDSLAEAISSKAFELAGDAAKEVRVVIDIPKMILLATSFRVDITIPPATPVRTIQRTVSIIDMSVAVIIGVNPPEREAKQRVILSFTFHEGPGTPFPPDYAAISASLHLKLESTAFLTLEKFVTEAARMGIMASERFQSITVRAQKPSALAFAHSSGVEITRFRDHFSTPSEV